MTKLKEFYCHCTLNQNQSTGSDAKNLLMKHFSFIALAIVLIIFQSCVKTGIGGEAGMPSAAPGGGNGGGTAGVITAGEWNDIQNWDFWKALLARDTIKEFPGKWGFYTQNRISVTLKDATDKLIHDAKIELACNGTIVSAKTDNFGTAQLYPGLFQENFTKGSFTLKATVNGQLFDLGSFSSGETAITRTVPVNRQAWSLE
jgi:hypothetical protein